MKIMHLDLETGGYVGDESFRGVRLVSDNTHFGKIKLTIRENLDGTFEIQVGDADNDHVVSAAILPNAQNTFTVVAIPR